MSENIILIADKLSKTFKGEKTKALDNISLQLKAGEKAVLIGADGCGKTTFLRMAAGLMLPDYPQKNPILINNLPPYNSNRSAKKFIGYMPQSFGLYEDLSVQENLELYAGLKSIPKNEWQETFNSLLGFAGLIEFKKRLAGNLSGGMKQKLGLCCTLLSKPKLLLLDEPSVGVDPISRKELLTLTDSLANENNIGIIWATSYLDEAQFFKKVIFFSEGKKVYEGSLDNAISKMRGLSFYVKSDGESVRKVLDKIQNNECLTDASIVGGSVRAVFKDINCVKNFAYELTPAEPVFEDFAIKQLGGKKPLTETFKEDIEETPPNNIALEANHLKKVYFSKNGEFTACDDINFKIQKGEIFGLLGPNGAGKSTTFKMLLGLVTPTSGTSKIMGYDIKKNPIEAKKSFGYMAQKFSLFGNLSTLQNLNFFMGVYGKNVIDNKELLENIITSFELEKYLNYNAFSLPLGYKQRLALACAIIHNPPVLFLDEPTSGVDPISRREFWTRINSLVKHKTTVLVTTHFMDEAQFCDRICIVYRGKMLIVDTPSNLKNSVKSKNNLNPTMEDAFIEIVKNASPAN